VLVFEARDRIGGRAHTEEALGFPLDVGCGWLHSADVNLFSRLAEALGFPLDKTPPHWTRQMAGIGMSRAEQNAYGKALGELEARVAATAARGQDLPVAALMDPRGRWNPLLDAFSSFYNGAEFDQISTLDYAAFEDSEINWRTPKGFGALIAAWAHSVPVVLGTPVSRLDLTGASVRVETGDGAVSAATVIVTVPTPLIADGTLAFHPDLPHVREAAAGLPLGLANKLFLKLDGPEAVSPESHLFGDPHRTATGSYHLRPFGRPLIEVYLGGRCARDLEAEGPGAASAFAIDELAHLLGSDVRPRLRPITASAWLEDPWARGAYSYALPGRAWARAALAQPVQDRIFFAGEAVSRHAFSTAHGAAETGMAAAEAALRALGLGANLAN
jgi:monoamine oxidase